MSSAVVFAYHNVGVRCLAVLLAHAVDVRLVVTHRDDPDENVWFDSVAALALLHGIPVVTPDVGELPELVSRLDTMQPDFLFSFYYRYMLPAAMLTTAKRGALNMHGSLLPQYRGRAPVNWAVLNGETETGASLHYMTAKPDAGDLVAQQAIPILPNDVAADVFDKVTCAAECCLDSVLPALLAGSAPSQTLDLSQGRYCGRRRPEDGRINWHQSAWNIHNLIRAVAPPYPGAFTFAEGKRLMCLKSFFRGEPARQAGDPSLYCEDNACYVDCRDGKRFRLLDMTLDGVSLTPADFHSRYGSRRMVLGD